jgi:hypothetical protein
MLLAASTQSYESSVPAATPRQRHSERNGGPPFLASRSSGRAAMQSKNLSVSFAFRSNERVGRHSRNVRWIIYANNVGTHEPALDPFSSCHPPSPFPAPFPHLPQRIRIHNQYTPRPVVPFMVLCIVTAAINPLRATETSASRFHLFCAFFAAYVAHLFSSFFSGRCTPFVHSLAPERKSTRVFSCACALFCINMGGGGLCPETPRVIINFQTPKHSLGETV